MDEVAVLALDGVLPFDLAVPVEVFGRVTLPDGRAPYRVMVCTPGESVNAAGVFTVRTPYRLDTLAEADTVVIPGHQGLDRPIPPDAIEAVRAAAAGGARVLSVCVGAFTLAATGLLDGLRVTTHWAAAPRLAAWFPKVRVDPDVLYVDNGHLMTSAGAAAGLDLCLHLVRRDHGSAVAADAARFTVMPLERAGGQAQFIAHEPPAPDGSTLEPVLRWLAENCERDLGIADVARQAGVSVRTLNRRFREQTGTTPLRWLRRARLRRAQCLLETTDLPVERIAFDVGFGSTATFRDRFQGVVGTSPQAYRMAFRGTGQR